MATDPVDEGVEKRRQAALERLTEGPPIPVYLDPGSFTWLKEIVEAKTKSQVWLKPYQRLVKRTLLSFEEAERAMNPDRPKRRTIPRSTKRKR